MRFKTLEDFTEPHEKVAALYHFFPILGLKVTAVLLTDDYTELLFTKNLSVGIRPERVDRYITWDEAKTTCTCTSLDLFRQGCNCGFISKGGKV